MEGVEVVGGEGEAGGGYGVEMGEDKEVEFRGKGGEGWWGGRNCGNMGFWSLFRGEVGW